eukprot:TRINITY_DN5576_c0_g1_i4.p1 TRINITY_DN5576_c0_g1~~TRINITY_DN5576_c0_g1_i4.p1  ORF type:complete len:647 (-),score=52.14 TRINITY_DN5576_c0_g1_i4:78-2018(-)
MDKRLLALYIWLGIETCINTYFGFVHIPKFFAGEVFVVTSMVNATARKCQSSNMTFNGDSVDTADQLMEAEDKFESPDCFADHGEVLWETTKKQLTWNGSTQPGWAKTEDINEPPDVSFSEKFSHILNGVVLFVCGFLAPSGEMIVRVIANIFSLANVEARAPRCYHHFHVVYKILQGPLQHLTQFKLYLCFLQMLLSVNVATIDVMSMKSGPGVEDFVVFVAWSIFLNTVVKKIEKPVLKGLPLNPHILPHPDWIPKLFSKYKGRYANTRIVLTVVKLVGFYLFYTLPVFTLIFNFEPVRTKVEGCPELPGDVKVVKYYTDSFLAIREGFHMMSEKQASWLMLIVLGFQFYICNLICPVFQIVHAIVQEMLEGHAPSWCTPWGWYVKNKVLPETNVLDEDDQYHRLSEQANERWSTQTPAKKFVALLIQCCVENQAHEYFVCALAMLIFVVMTVFKDLHLDHNEMECGTFSVSLCYDPFVCVWLIASIPLLGRARAKLYVLDEEAGSMVQWTRHFRPENKYRFLLVFWIFLAVAIAYGLVFRNTAITSYFGEFTMTPTYVRDHDTGVLFDCFYFNYDDGRQGRECFSMTTPEGKPLSNRKLIHDASKELSTLVQEAMLSSLFTGGGPAWSGLGGGGPAWSGLGGA